jgi:MFS superfamily sulfate permease-like transporter
VIALAAGLAMLGFLASFVSKPILIGYIAGVAIFMIIGRLGKLIGITIESEPFFQQMRNCLSLFSQIGRVASIQTSARNEGGPAFLMKGPVAGEMSP